ncbi:Methylmalonyl-CoA mutase, cobalamin-binding subunit [Desulfacinum hydrothermale DSM 13146]|uniref:Methylmalonyl-CoA mutase, cobalamin-binding subunit n=1 Tax=Desulfacinum hydrothermale DSM 13146 TaxID=1121390 RepID=A0A1W1X919_9BACT|nr:cobalamin B12-binding domain-containing protein [Desulfacinum hydrothermale]SMC19981.1 Methylmalonyl-CoA mutase, cobalamin-binding subunit [Desulfacinum hydrothermale DSM 13146]
MANAPPDESPSLQAFQDAWAHLRKCAQEFLNGWKQDGIPPRWALLQSLRKLDRTRIALLGDDLPFPFMPRMYLATLDDGWGHGLDAIELAGRGLGAPVRRLGLMMAPEQILAACVAEPPHILGLTVLHNDSEPALARICRGIPPQTAVLGGGTAFSLDPDLAQRTGVHKVARHARDFLHFLLTYAP